MATYFNAASPPNETYVPYDVDPGRISEWQVSLEHSFAHNYMASLAYVGSHATNLQYPTDINQITNLATINAIAAGTTTVQANRPYPFWATGGNNFNATSNYNALQAIINKQFSNGLTFSFNYVWSHMLDSQDSGGMGQPWWNAGLADWERSIQQLRQLELRHS